MLLALYADAAAVDVYAPRFFDAAALRCFVCCASAMLRFAVIPDMLILLSLFARYALGVSRPSRRCRFDIDAAAYSRLISITPRCRRYAADISFSLFSPLFAAYFALPGRRQWRYAFADILMLIFSRLPPC